jgi:hypothetical protein
VTLIATYPDPLVEALATHEFLRKCGFASEQIFVHRNPEPLLDVVVVLKHLGKQFVVSCGMFDSSEWQTLWTAIVENYNSGKISEAEFQCRYSTSWVFTNRISMLWALHEKGIEPPLGAN